MEGDKQRFGDVGENVIGGSIKGDKNILGEKVNVVNNTYYLSLGKDGEKRVEELLSIKKDVSPQYGQQAEPRSGEDVERMKSDLETLTGIVDELKKRNSGSQELYAGKLKVSTVEMLLKRAILLKTEADQIVMDSLQGNSELSGFRSNNNRQADTDKIGFGYNEIVYRDKLNEALTLLRQANDEEPTNIEVLLHMAQIVGLLEPDFPDKERKLIAKALGLLKNPKNDDEWFLKAEATFLMATAGDETHPNLLRDARGMFERLQRNEWVRQCDDLLIAFDNEYDIPHIARNSTGSQGPQAQNFAEFHPVGRWHVDASDGSIIDAHFFQNGVVQGTQKNTMKWQNFSFSGQWAYIPYSRILQIQGSTNMGYPVMQVIGIQHKEGDTFFGFDLNGFQYRFRKL